MIIQKANKLCIGHAAKSLKPTREMQTNKQIFKYFMSEKEQEGSVNLLSPTPFFISIFHF